MKQILKKLLPTSTLTLLCRITQRAEDTRNATRSARDVFTEIYRKEKWGGKKDRFCSGSGSTLETITEPYIDMVIRFLMSIGRDKTIVDLGCGDMDLGKRFVNYCETYIGVDVVPDLIENHKRQTWGSNVRFQCLDIINDPLPEADICFLRQVLQHLSNEEIAKILPKLEKYKVVFITEHHPTPNPDIIPNKNSIHGPGVRVYYNSGVYLNKPPFNIAENRLKLVLKVDGMGLGAGFDAGEIVTYQLENATVG